MQIEFYNDIFIKQFVAKIWLEFEVKKVSDFCFATEICLKKVLA